MFKNGEKQSGKARTERWRSCSLLKQIHWSQHDSYESTGLTVHHHETKDYTVPQILPFFMLECLSAFPDHPIMKELIRHYVTFI